MNIVGTSILVFLLIAVAKAPRRGALLAIMGGVLYLTQGQQVNILGFNLFAHRFIELAAFIRVVARREFTFSSVTRIDKIFLVLFAYTTIVFFIRSSESPAYQMGAALDAYLCYFSFRGLLKDADDYRWFLRTFLWLLTPYVLLVLVESFANYNIFTSQGGIEYGDWTRGGRPRCQGSFRHPSLLGTLGASFFPLYIGLWFDRQYRKIATFAIGLCLIIVWASNSGGPVNMTAMGIVGWAFWRFRHHMKFVRRATFGGVLLLAIVMKAPIWYLPAKVSSLSGGDGYHRSYLMEMAFKSVGDWWLGGMPIQETVNWFPYILEVTGGADMTNQFLSFGVTAGLAALGLFIVLLVQAFKMIGSGLLAARSEQNHSSIEPLLWGLGVMLLGHLFNWLGITYFDQTYIVWYFQLAVLVNLSEAVQKPIHSIQQLTPQGLE